MAPPTNSCMNSSLILSLSSSKALSAFLSSVRTALGVFNLEARIAAKNYYSNLGGGGIGNKYNMMIDGFPLAELLPGRAFFKKGELYSHFYFLEEGRACVTVAQVPIEVTAPIFLGDYEPFVEMEYRTSSIKAVTRCQVRTLPLEMLAKAGEHHNSILAAFDKFSLCSRVLRYWLAKLFTVSQHARNDFVTCGQAIGVVLRGQFRLSSQIPIVRMKQPLQLLRRFQICSIGEHELFAEDLICESHRGSVGLMDPRYVGQLAANFEEFGIVMSVASSKRMMHAGLTKEIAKNCRKKRNLFQNMVPLTLQECVQQEHSENEESVREMTRLASSEEVFSVKDNITQFLHNQWRRGLSLKLPRKMKESPLQTLRKRRVDLINPQIISLQLPRQFKEVKFNFKMLLKTKEHPLLRSKRMRTEPSEHPQRKLLFCD